jgi:hypothetical protein
MVPLRYMKELLSSLKEIDSVAKCNRFLEDELA